jgi:ribosomal protein L31
MKIGIHPKYFPNATVTCACGNTWHTGSTVESIHTDVCSNCHPFYTGEQRIVDTEGQVDRFYKKLQARQEFLADQEARASRTSPDCRSPNSGLGAPKGPWRGRDHPGQAGHRATGRERSSLLGGRVWSEEPGRPQRRLRQRGFGFGSSRRAGQRAPAEFGGPRVYTGAGAARHASFSDS